MTLGLWILVGIGAFFALRAVNDIVARRREQHRLREELGEDYDDYLDLRDR